jgi:adenylate kinase
MKTPVYVLFGAPGAGKGTQSTLLVRTLGYRHLSTGSVLRQQMDDPAWVAANPQLSQSIQRSFDSGGLVSDDTVLAVVVDALRRPAPGFILDGFPRTLPQAELLWAAIAQSGCEFKKALHLDLSETDCELRLLSRQDNRPDDNQETILTRLRVYNHATAPLVFYYQSLGCYGYVNAEGTPEQVYERLSAHLA